MTLSELIVQVRRLTRTNSTGYPDSDVKADLNRNYQEIWATIIEAEGSKNIAGGFKIHDNLDVTSLVSGDIGFNGEYPNPADSMEIEKIFLDYGNGHKQADIIQIPFDSQDEFDIDAINAYYSVDSPKVWMLRDSFFIRPLSESTVTDGIKLIISRRPTALDGSTDVPAFEEIFHNLLALKVASDYYLVYPEKFNPKVEQKVRELESQLISFYQDRTPQNIVMRAVKEQW